MHKNQVEMQQYQQEMDFEAICAYFAEHPDEIFLDYEIDQSVEIYQVTVSADTVYNATSIAYCYGISAAEWEEMRCYRESGEGDEDEYVEAAGHICDDEDGSDDDEYSTGLTKTGTSYDKLISWSSCRHILSMEHQYGGRTFTAMGDIETKRKTADNWLSEISPKRYFAIHEVVNGKQPFKAFLDIDAKMEDIRRLVKDSTIQQFAGKLGRIYIEAFKDVSKCDIPPVVFYTIRSDKLSYHIFSQDGGYICKNVKEYSRFLTAIKKKLYSYPYYELENAAANYIDSAFNGKPTFCLRLPQFPKIAGQPSYNKDTILKPFNDIAVPYDKPSRCFLQTCDIRWRKDNKKTFVSDTISASTIKEVDDAINGNEWAKSLKYVPVDINGIIARYERISSGYCPGCDVIHDGGRANAFLVKAKQGPAYILFCYHTQEIDGKKKPMFVYDPAIPNKNIEPAPYVRDVFNAIIDTATINVNKKHIDEEIHVPALDGNDLYIRSSYGTGKTTLICKYTELIKKEGKSCLIVSSRRSYSSKVVSDTAGIKYSDKQFMYHNTGVYVCQLDSIHNKLSTFLPDGENHVGQFDLVIVDEIAALAAHAYASGHALGKAHQGFIDLHYIISKCGKLIVADNDLSDWIIEAFKSIRQDKNNNPIVVNNVRKVWSKLKCNIYSRKNHDIIIRSAMHAFLDEQVALRDAGKPWNGAVIITHRREHVEKIEKELKDKYPGSKILSYTADTSTDDRQALSDVNTNWDGALAVIYNQTISVGVSFDGAHFSNVYAIFSMENCIGAMQSCQSIFRCRQIKSIDIGCGTCRVYSANNTARKVKKYMLANCRGRISLSKLANNTAEDIDAIPITLFGGKNIDEAIDNFIHLDLPARMWFYTAIMQGRSKYDFVSELAGILSDQGVKPVIHRGQDDIVDGQLLDIKPLSQLSKIDRSDLFYDRRDKLVKLATGDATEEERDKYKEVARVMSHMYADPEGNLGYISTKDKADGEHDMEGILIAAKITGKGIHEVTYEDYKNMSDINNQRKTAAVFKEIQKNMIEGSAHNTPTASSSLSKDCSKKYTLFTMPSAEEKAKVVYETVVNLGIHNIDRLGISPVTFDSRNLLKAIDQAKYAIIHANRLYDWNRPTAYAKAVKEGSLTAKQVITALKHVFDATGLRLEYVRHNNINTATCQILPASNHPSIFGVSRHHDLSRIYMDVKKININIQPEREDYEMFVNMS